MKLKYLFLILISLPLSECYNRVCAARAVLKTDIEGLKESVKAKDKLKNCGDYPCVKAFLKLQNNETNKSFSLDVRDCLIEYPCNDEEYDNEGDWEKLINQYGNSKMNQKLKNFTAKLSVKCCKEDYCNMSLKTRYNIGSIMPIVILGLILIKGLNV